MVPFRQCVASMSGPTKELEKLNRRRLRHGGQLALRWMASNVALASDRADKIKVDRHESHDAVHALVALVMAIRRAMAQEDEGVWPSWGAV